MSRVEPPEAPVAPAAPRPPVYVRVTARRPGGLVELELGLGEPELCTTLLLPAFAIDELCRVHGATRLPDADADAAAPTPAPGGPR